MTCGQYFVVGISGNVWIGPLMIKRLIQLPISLFHKFKRNQRDNRFGERCDIEQGILGRRVTLPHASIDFIVPQHAVFDDANSQGWHAVFLQQRLHVLLLVCRLLARL